MAEILFQKYDHNTSNLSHALQVHALLKPMDAITIQENGHGWGDQDMKNPWFRLVFWPALSVEDAIHLLAPHQPELDHNKLPMTIKQHRMFHLDFAVPTVLPPGFSQWWNDDNRTIPFYTLELPLACLFILQQKRASVRNPDYTGIPPGAPAKGIS